jgi:hypothetical protein
LAGQSRCASGSTGSTPKSGGKHSTNDAWQRDCPKSNLEGKTSFGRLPMRRRNRTRIVGRADEP